MPSRVTHRNREQKNAAHRATGSRYGVRQVFYAWLDLVYFACNACANVRTASSPEVSFDQPAVWPVHPETHKCVCLFFGCHICRQWQTKFSLPYPIHRRMSARYRQVVLPAAARRLNSFAALSAARRPRNSPNSDNGETCAKIAFAAAKPCR